MYSVSLILESINFNLIINYVSFIMLLFKKLNIRITIIRLPKKIQKITLLRSPHVHKKSKVNYKKVTHKTLLRFSSKDAIFMKYVYSQILLRKPKSLNIMWKFHFSACT